MSLLHFIGKISDRYLFEDYDKLKLYDKDAILIGVVGVDLVDRVHAKAIHLVGDSSEPIISMITSQSVDFGDSYYQAYSTEWFKLCETKENIFLKSIGSWESSNILHIKSKIFDSKCYWLSTHRKHYIDDKNKIRHHSYLGFSSTSPKSQTLPVFSYIQLSNYDYVGLAVDFYVFEEFSIIAFVTGILGNKAVILKIDKSNKHEYFEVDIPVRKCHEIRMCKIMVLNNVPFVFFQVIPNDSCKKYIFELWVLKIESELGLSKLTRAIDSDSAFHFSWNFQGKLTYTINRDNICRIGLITESGKIAELAQQENLKPVCLNDDNTVLAIDENRNNLFIVKLGE